MKSGKYAVFGGSNETKARICVESEFTVNFSSGLARGCQGTTVQPKNFKANQIKMNENNKYCSQNTHAPKQ